MKRRLLAGLVPAILAFSGPALADIYAFVDSNGVRHLSNVPNDPRYKLVMRTPDYSRNATRPSSYAPGSLYSMRSAAPAAAPLNARATRTRLSQNAENNRRRFAPDIDRIASHHRLDPALMHAVISAESSYNPWAVSNKGAMGLMQLMPATAERFGVDNPYDPIANMHGGARYLRWLLDRFNDPRLAVAAYNAGEGAVQKYGNQVPPYQETQTYVVRVLNFYQHYRGSSPAAYSTVAYNGAGTYNTTYRQQGSRPAGYNSNTGVTIITPRGGRGSALPPTTTYLPPSNGQFIMGGSDGGGRAQAPRIVRVGSGATVADTASPAYNGK